MSLENCIKKAGNALSQQDADALRLLVDGGLTPEQAIEQHLSDIDGELEGIAASVEDAGGTVAMQQPELVDDTKKFFIEQNKKFIEDKKTEGFDIKVDGDYVTLYHGTSKASAKSINKSGEIRDFPFFAYDVATAKRFGQQAISRGKPEILEMKVNLGDILVTGGYFSANAQSLVRADDGSWSAKVDEPRVLAQAAVPPVETEAFKSWFGDSKVVDEAGDPLVVYHGTNQDIDTFDVTRLGDSTGTGSAGKGIFFTNNPDNAAEFAKQAGVSVIPDAAAFDVAVEDIQKKMTKAEKANDWDEVDKLTIEWESLELGAIAAPDITGQNVLPVYLSMKNPLIIDYQGRSPGGEVAENGKGISDYIDDAKDGDHDGLIMKSINDSAKDIVSDHYVVFEPPQIKSAITRGAFDPTDPRIMFQTDEPTEDDILAMLLAEFDTVEDAPRTRDNSIFKIEEARDRRDEMDLPADRAKVAGFTSERIEELLEDYSRVAYGTTITEARARIAYIDPIDFVALTHPDVTVIEGEATPLDVEQLRSQVDVPNLRINTDGSIVTHEGRHRMMALAKAGFKSVPVVISFDEYTSDASDMNLKGQEFRDGKGIDLKIKNAVPILPELVGQFTSDDIDLLFQAEPTPDEIRASIQFTDDNESIIRLTRASDLSSFLHESGHLFLEMEKRFADKFGVTPEMQGLFDWLGVDGFDDLTVEHHEKFAETFEVYLRDGKSPSLKLRAAFMAFRRWLVSVYKSLGLQDPRLARADLTPEIREYMDRMLATDAEIEQATANPAYDQYFKSKEQAGMSDSEWDAYQEQAQKATDKATVDLDQKVIDEMRKRKTTEWKDERTSMIDEEMTRLSETPVYQILEEARNSPMDRAMFKEIGDIKKIPSSLRGVTITDGTGLEPELFAEYYGFSSAKAMIEALTDAPKLTKAAYDAAEARMIDKYGDMLNDGRIELEAREVIHNDEQAKLLLQELKALNRKVGAGKPKINREYLKAEVKKLIGTMTFREIKPNGYYRAEVKAAQRAVTAKTDAEKLEAKTQQIINHYMYREAVEVKAVMKAQRKRIKAVRTREYKASEVQPDFSQNMRTLASLYDMRNKPEQQRSVTQLLEFYESQSRYMDITMLDNNLILAMEAKERGELALLNLPSFDDLTADDLRGLDEMLRHLRYAGGRMSDVVKAEMTADRRELTDFILEKGGKDKKVTRGVPRREESTRRQISHLVNKLPSLRNLMRKIDGFDENGAGFRLIFRTIENAKSKKIKLQREMYDKFEQEMDGIHSVSLNMRIKDFPLENGETLSLPSESVYMMALYWGTESSRVAIMEGFGVTENDVMKILSSLNQEQLQLVNATWRVNEYIWPQLSAAHVELYGVSPSKLDPTSFTVNGVKLTGGHMRLFYDSTEIELKGVQEEAGSMSSIMPTKAGSLHARVGSGGRPPMLDKNNIIRAINDNVHYIAFAEASAKIKPLINSTEVKNAIERKHGTGVYLNIIETIDGITSDRKARESMPGVASMFRLLRRAMVFKYLLYSVRNTVQQITSIPIAMDEVGTGAWLTGIIRFSSPKGYGEMTTFANERSNFMRERASLVNREAAEYLRTITVDGKIAHAWDQFAKFGFTPQTIIDSIIAYPVWNAKYEQGINDHGDEGRAISEADTAVAESVGSGSDLHLGGAFQSNNTEFVKLFTIFGSWFNAYYQRMYKATKGGEKYISVESMKAIIVTPFIIAMISAILIMDFPKDDEDWYSWAVKRYGQFLAGTVPILRDIIGAFSGFAPKTVFSGAATVPQQVTGVIGKIAEEGEVDVKSASSLLKAATIIVPMPGSGNVVRMMDYMDSYGKGKEGEFNAYQAIVKGPTR